MIVSATGKLKHQTARGLGQTAERGLGPLPTFWLSAGQSNTWTAPVVSRRLLDLDLDQRR